MNLFVSETRWTARLDAVKPFAAHLESILAALKTLTKKEFPSLTATVIADINGLKKYLSSYSSVLLSSIWFKILKTIDIRNQLLQVVILTGVYRQWNWKTISLTNMLAFPKYHISCSPLTH